MIQPADSLSVATTDNVQPVSTPSGGGGWLTPARVLSWLPRNATPAQQDSAIQAHFKPSEIHWSTRPDTLHLPGHDKGRNMLDVQLPQYYREGFFSNDTLFHPELPGGRYGVAGDPVPYNVRGDNVITLLLLALFVFSVIAFSNSRMFIVRQTRSFFYSHKTDSMEVTETAVELRFQFVLAFMTCLLYSLFFYFHTIAKVGSAFVLPSEYYLIFVFLALFIVYFLLKTVAYSAVNNVFFDRRRNKEWLQTLLFITAMEGVLLFPAVMLQTYFELSLENVETYFIIVLIIVKILTFYKCFVIFFRGKVLYVQIFLYFCALEIVPMLALWGAHDMIVSILKINF